MASCQYTYVPLFLVFFACFVCSSCAYQLVVGGRDGWTLHPSENYNHWAERMRFQVNDTLLFKYNRAIDSVLVVNRADYDSCNTANPIRRLDDGSSIFKFDRSGPFYFISGNRSNCDQGQKLIIVVLAVRNNRYTPPGVPSHTPPPPSGGASGPATSPSTSPGAPGPSYTPGAGAPGSYTPGAGAPGSSPPGAGAPGSSPPGAGAPGPGSSTPGAGAPGPGSSAPGAGAPGPGSPTPGAGAPGSSPPGAGGAPGSSAPGAEAPSSSSTPGAGGPGSSTPGAGAPGAGNTPADANAPPGSAQSRSLAVPARTPPRAVLMSVVSLVLSVGLSGFITSS